MDTRYSHPMVDRLWSPQFTYDSWLEIERCVLRAQREADPAFGERTEALWLQLQRCWIDERAVDEIRRIERQETKHDVAAFLQYMREAVGIKNGPPLGQWLHHGLTSSDLVDTTQALRFLELYDEMAQGISDLVGTLSTWTDTDIPIAGRTHGQIGEPTSMKARAWHWLSTLEPAMVGLLRATKGMQYAKLSGPMGTYAHNAPEIEVKVALLLKLRPMGQGASQIVPRSALAMWANAAAVFAASCSKIATDLRLMNLLGQASWAPADKQVGSSAMPHKNNPIVAEQINGLARMANGYAAMLQPLDLWLERDISNSCVERVAVPDLWHTLLWTIKQTTWLLTELKVNEHAIQYELAEHANSLWSHRVTLEAISDGMSWEKAREFAQDYDVVTYDVIGDARWWTRQYPGGKR